MSKTTPATLANFSSSATSPHSRSSATTSLTHKWNLTPLFASKQALDTFLKETQKQVLAFEKKYSSSLAKLMPDEFLDSIMQYESLIERISRIMTYAFLVFAEDTTKGDFYGKYEMLSNEIYEHLLFFELEFCNLPAKIQKSFIKASKKYSFYLQNLLAQKVYQLELNVEKALMATSAVGVNAFSRLFDEHLASLKIGKHKQSEEEVLALLYSNDRKVRKKAQKDFSKSLQDSSALLSYILNMVRKDLSIQKRLRNYPNKEIFRHIANQTTQKSVDTMIKIVNKNFHIVHQYYAIKSQVLGFKLKDYDRYAPIYQSNTTLQYNQALELVIQTYSAFSKPFGEIAKKAIKEGWVSSHPTPNKRGGAFSHGCVPSAHPYVLLNWTGNRRDAFTIAHEFGHMIHQELSKSVGCLNHDTPLTTAETASVFGEMLLFDYLKQNLNTQELLSIYSSKLEDIFSTLFRQIVMTNFERAIHNQEHELKIQDFDRIWREENQKMFGESLALTKRYDRWWSYIPHFIHSPFYCYAYSYGQLLVLALFGLYKSGKCKNFVKLYTNFLSAGGSKSPRDLIKTFGFDIEDERFWQIGIKEVQKMLQEFQELQKRLLHVI